MKGNDKIPITAEAVALMKSQAGDRFSKYFVTPRIVRVNSFVSRFFSEDLLSNVFARRISLSDDMQKAVQDFKPQQVVDFGAGYSQFGLEYALAHPNCRFIEVDFPSVISKKRDKIKEIRRAEELGRVDNLNLVEGDIVSEDLMRSLKKHLVQGKRTLVYSIGVDTYLNSGEYSSMLANVLGVLNYVGKGAYLAHNPTRVQINKAKTSIGGKVLRGLVSVITGSRQNIHYYNEIGLKRKLIETGFESVDILKKRKDNTIYLAKI